jgi:hypothetical protein
MATIRRCRWLLLGAGFVALLGVAALQAPRPINGQGVLYPHLWCIGIKFDDGSGLPVSSWPNGWQARGSESVVVDPSGEIVLRAGDRVAVRGKVTHADGDRPCAYTEILAVDSVERLPAAPHPSAAGSGG